MSVQRAEGIKVHTHTQTQADSYETRGMSVLCQ